jgi:hypothetical protein
MIIAVSSETKEIYWVAEKVHRRRRAATAYRTSNSVLACVGDKCMFAPMNLSICPSVIPP